MSTQSQNNKRNKVQDLRETRQWIFNEHGGKLPPQAIELEEAVLGAALVEKVGLAIVTSMMRPEHFYKSGHICVMEALLSLVGKGKKVDLLTVTQELRTLGKLEDAGGQVAIARLTNRVASTANVEEHCLIVLQQFMKREVIRLSGIAGRDAYDETTDALELINQFQLEMLKVSGIFNIRQAQSTGVTITEVINDALKPREDYALSGVDTGYVDLNLLTGGWQKKNLIILAARPGQGKTAFAVNFAWRSAAIGKKRVLFCSMEMGVRELQTRLLAMVTTASAQNISNRLINNWERSQIEQFGYLAGPKELYIDDTPSLTPSLLRSKIIYMRSSGGCDMVVVDYLQLMETGMGDRKYSNREQEVSFISRQLKMIAMEFDLPVIALSQMSREVEKVKRKPRLSDLRESGAIEQDANMVCFLFNPHDVGIPMEGGGEFDPRYTELLIQKNRNGPLADVPFLYIKQCSRVLGTSEQSKNIFHVDHEENPHEQKNKAF